MPTFDKMPVQPQPEKSERREEPQAGSPEPGATNPADEAGRPSGETKPNPAAAPKKPVDTGE